MRPFSALSCLARTASTSCGSSSDVVFVDLNVDRHCPGCPAENRPSIRLGKSFNLPQKRTEDRWQFADAITWLIANRSGQHTVKSGFDVSFVRDDNFFPLNFAGTFTFTHDLPFDPANANTYPAQFTNSAGPPNVNLEDRMYAIFLQDQWRPTARLTFNAGIRWDYEDAPGISHDIDNIAPRLGFSYDLTGTAKTVLRGSYGHYYDQVYLLVPREVEQAAALVQARIDNPGYPDPLGPNPRRTGSRPLIPSTTVYGTNMKTAVAAEATLGIQHELGANTVLALDGVWAEGYHLLAGHDLNYPDLNDPLRPRPNPNSLVIQAYETRGNSWYTGLQASLKRLHANRYSYFVAYTLSSSERDTEDFRFAPQDQRDYAADRGPGRKRFPSAARREHDGRPAI
jgi:TonB dependent receptor-like, beta-barrel